MCTVFDRGRIARLWDHMVCGHSGSEKEPSAGESQTVLRACREGDRERERVCVCVSERERGRERYPSKNVPLSRKSALFLQPEDSRAKTKPRAKRGYAPKSS